MKQDDVAVPWGLPLLPSVSRQDAHAFQASPDISDGRAGADPWLQAPACV